MDLDTNSAFVWVHQSGGLVPVLGARKPNSDKYILHTDYDYLNEPNRLGVLLDIADQPRRYKAYRIDPRWGGLILNPEHDPG